VRKIHLVGLTLFAVIALSAIGATSAFAASEILFLGLEIKELLPIETTGELLLEDTGANPKLDLDCSGTFDGMIEPGGKLFFVEALLMLGGELLNEAGVLNGEGNDMIDCKVLPENTTCEKNEALVTVNLNGITLWHVELLLDTFELSGGEIMTAYLGHFLTGAESGIENVVTPMYTVDCVNPLIGLIEDLCEGLSSARLYVDAAGNLRGSFNSLALAKSTDEWAAESEKTTCSIGGAGTGLVESINGAETDTEGSGGIITAVGGGALTLS